MLNRIAELLLESLKLADPRLRVEILNTRVFAHPQLSAEFRRSAAQALLPLLRSADHPETSDRAAGLLEALGEIAAEGLLDVARKNPNAPEAEVALRALGRIFSAHRSSAWRSRPMSSLRAASAAPTNAQGGAAGGAWLIASSRRSVPRRRARRSNCS